MKNETKTEQPTPFKPEKRLRITVGINCLSEIQYPAYTNHIQFWYRLGRSYPGIDFVLCNPARMSIDRMRNMAAKVSLESESDYLLFLDDDVIVPPNHGLKQLLECEADIAAGRVCVRGWPFAYMSFKGTKDGGLVIEEDIPKTGIYKTDAVGFSFALIKTSLIKKMSEPYFITGLKNTEDIYFCMMARAVEPKCTIKINCDCECGHILWPEVLFESNREAYREYFLKINPQAKPPKKRPNNDRGAEYLKEVKETEL